MPFSNSLLYLALACLLDIFNFPTLCLAEWPAWTVLHALGFLLAILILYISPLPFCKKVIDQGYNGLAYLRGVLCIIGLSVFHITHLMLCRNLRHHRLDQNKAFCCLSHLTLSLSKIAGIFTFTLLSCRFECSTIQRP